MTTLLITTLGSAGRDEARHGHLRARYRLPGAERIVETQHLGLELARALQASKICFVGTTTAFFDQLAYLLPPEAAAAPVAEAQEAHVEEVADEPEAAPLTEDASDDADTTAANDDDDAASPSDDEDVDAASDEQAACESAAAAEACATSECATSVDAAASDVSGSDAAAAPAATPAVADATDAAPAAAPSVPRKVHVPDTRSLTERLVTQARTGRPDAAALNALAKRLAVALHMQHVECLLISDPTSPRATMHALRTLSELPDDGDEVHMDVSFGPRSLPVAAFLAIQYLRRFRPDVRTGSVFMAAPEHADEAGIVPVNSLDGADELMHWMGLFEALVDGRAPQALHTTFMRDRWLNRLAGPYVRFQRGQRFGALSEVIEGAKLVEEKRRSLRRLPSTHPFRLFDPVLQHALRPFVSDAAPSSKQFVLAVQSMRQGNLPLAALHLRDTMMSACLEAYGRRAAEAWMDVPGSGGAQQVRPRDVASFVLSTPSIASQLAPLDIVWPLIAMARNRYVNTSPTTVRAGQLKDEDHEVGRAVEMVGALLHNGAFARLPELLPFELAVQQSIDLRAVRARDAMEGRFGRGQRNDRRGPRPQRGRDNRFQGGGPEGQAPEGGAPGGAEGGAPAEGGGVPSDGGARRQEGGDRGPRGPREGGPGNGRPYGDRGPRGPRDGGGPGQGRPYGDRGPGGGERGPRGPGGGPGSGGPRGPRDGGGPGQGRPYGDRGPRPEGDRGPRQRDENAPEDTTPRVSQARGLGNLGLALAQAGLVGRGKDHPPRHDTPAQPQAEAQAAPQPPSTPTTPEFPVAGP
ncbi:MAG: hypothetical protein EXS14_07475 [Planctomycetes bacterium]|nr:hypothetical protein [Planctomycetota bacterium]